MDSVYAYLKYLRVEDRAAALERAQQTPDLIVLGLVLDGLRGLAESFQPEKLLVALIVLLCSAGIGVVVLCLMWMAWYISPVPW